MASSGVSFSFPMPMLSMAIVLDQSKCSDESGHPYIEPIQSSILRKLFVLQEELLEVDTHK